MAKFHIDPAGNPGVCRARKNCPYGDLTEDHYGSAEEARRSYELENTSREHILSGGVKETLEEVGPRQLPNSAYSIVDRAMYYNRFSEHELYTASVAVSEEIDSLKRRLERNEDPEHILEHARMNLPALERLKERFEDTLGMWAAQRKDALAGEFPKSS